MELVELKLTAYFQKWNKLSYYSYTVFSLSLLSLNLYASFIHMQAHAACYMEALVRKKGTEERRLTRRQSWIWRAYGMGMTYVKVLNVVAICSGSIQWTGWGLFVWSVL